MVQPKRKRTKRIPLTQGKSAKVSSDDAKKVGDHDWYAADVGGGDVYAARKVPKPGGGQKTVYMHQEIKPAGKGKVVHHKDGDMLDNTRPNLKRTGQSGNQKGVKHRRKKSGK